MSTCEYYKQTNTNLLMNGVVYSCCSWPQYFGNYSEESMW